MLIIIHTAELEHPEDLDGNISSRGREDAMKVAKSISCKYGVPDCIISSPYTQARQTLDSLTEALCTNKIATEINKDLSRFLPDGKCCEEKVKRLLPMTLSFCPPVCERLCDFKERVCRMYEMRYKEGVIWMITHSSVMREMSNLMGSCPPKKLDIFHYIVVKGKKHCPPKQPCGCSKRSPSCASCNEWKSMTMTRSCSCSVRAESWGRFRVTDV